MTTMEIFLIILACCVWFAVGMLVERRRAAKAWDEIREQAARARSLVFTGEE